MCYIRKLVHMQIKDNYIKICASCSLNAISSVTRKTGILLFNLLAYVPQQICLPHYTYIPLYCYFRLHIDLILQHTLVKFKHTATLIYYSTAMYVPATNIPIKWHICYKCKLLNMHHVGRKPAYMVNINLLPSILWPEYVYMWNAVHDAG